MNQTVKGTDKYIIFSCLPASATELLTTWRPYKPVRGDEGYLFCCSTLNSRLPPVSKTVSVTHSYRHSVVPGHNCSALRWNCTCGSKENKFLASVDQV